MRVWDLHWRIPENKAFNCVQKRKRKRKRKRKLKRIYVKATEERKKAGRELNSWVAHSNHRLQVNCYVFKLMVRYSEKNCYRFSREKTRGSNLERNWAKETEEESEKERHTHRIERNRKRVVNKAWDKEMENEEKNANKNPNIQENAKWMNQSWNTRVVSPKCSNGLLTASCQPLLSLSECCRSLKWVRARICHFELPWLLLCRK